MKSIIKPKRLYWPTLFFLMLFSVCGIAQNTLTGVSKVNDRLAFSSRESLEAAIATLERQVNEYVDTREEPQEGEYFDPSPTLANFERSLGFNSLRVKALNFEFDQLRRGVDPADLIEYSWLMDDVLASLVNENHVIQVGSDIYIAKPQGYIRIPNRNEAVLSAIIRGESRGAFPDVEVAGDGEVGDGTTNDGNCLADFSYTTSYASSLVGTFQFSGTAPADATYYWTFGHGTASSTLKNPQHQFPGQGDYNVCLTLKSEKDTCSSQICKTLEVNQGCLAMFNCTNTGTSGLVNFSATGSFAQFGSIISYEWNFGDGQTGTGVNVAHQYNCDGDRTVTLSITTSTGCKNTFSKKARVASFSCCDNNVKKDDSYSTGNKKKVNVKAWDVQFLWWNNVKSRMSHYKKVVIWWPNRQKLRSDLVGNVYIKNQTGCACFTPHNVAESDTKNNWWRLVVKHQVGERFNTKLNNEWRAKYWVNDVAYPDLVPQVSCNQSNCN